MDSITSTKSTGKADPISFGAQNEDVGRDGDGGERRYLLILSKRNVRPVGQRSYNCRNLVFSLLSLTTSLCENLRNTFLIVTAAERLLEKYENLAKTNGRVAKAMAMRTQRITLGI